MRKLKRAVIKEELVDLTGNLNEAIVLNQLIFWSERVKDSDTFLQEEIERTKRFNDGSQMNPEDIEDTLLNGWIYKTSEEMLSETMLTCSKSTIERVFKSLVDNGFISRRRNPKYRWDKTWQYRVDLHFVNNKLGKLGYALEGYSLPANTQETQVEASKPQIEDSIRHHEASILHSDVSKRHGDAAIPYITTEITTEITTKTTTKESDVAEIIKMWDENNFGKKNNKAKQSLLSYLDNNSFENPKEMIVEAMSIACGNNKRFGRFVEGILNNWINEGIRDLENINLVNSRKYNKSSNKDVIPDWFKDRKRQDNQQVDELTDQEKKAQEEMIALLEKYDSKEQKQLLSKL